MQGNYGLFWLNDDFFDECLEIIDQRRVPFEYHTKHLTNTSEVVNAIKELPLDGGAVRGIAILGIYIIALEVEGDYEKMLPSAELIKECRYDVPNLKTVVDQVMNLLRESQNIIEDARKYALSLCDKIEQESEKIAEFGSEVIENISKKKINILIHSSNRSILALIHKTISKNLEIHIWVEASESQILWELSKNGFEHSIINESGSLLQNREIDLIIVGAIMIDESGKITSKVGTYLKALAAYESAIPFYVAALELDFGSLDTQIEPQEQPLFSKGIDLDGVFREIRTTQNESKSINYRFDTTAAKFITGFITCNGIHKVDFDKIGKKFN